MANLSKQDVEKIAHLARLDMNENDVSAFTNSLGNILNLIEQMQQVDTSEVKPMSHSAEMSLRLREDEVTETNQRDNFQQLAPATEAGLYLVPQVIE